MNLHPGSTLPVRVAKAPFSPHGEKGARTVGCNVCYLVAIFSTGFEPGCDGFATRFKSGFNRIFRFN